MQLRQLDDRSLGVSEILVEGHLIAELYRLLPDRIFSTRRHEVRQGTQFDFLDERAQLLTVRCAFKAVIGP